MSKMTDELTQWILQFQSGRAFYNKLNSDVTKRIYLKRLKEYCDSVGKDPDELVQLKVEGLQNIGSSVEFQAENCLETYLSTVNLTLNMKVSAKTAIMSFYAKNRRRLEPDVAENIERGESEKRCPKIGDIVELENAMITQRDKALLWFIASAPIRVGTIPKLKWKDLKPTHDPDVPYYLRIESARLKGAGKGKYRGAKQIAFLHSLSVQKLKSYRLEAKRRGYKLGSDSPIFISYRQKGIVKSFSPYTINSMFTDASLTAWHDLDTKRYSPHDFRDFVQSALENAGINPNIIKPILAHKIRGVDKHYSTHDITDFMQKFKTALPYLLPQSIENVKAEIEKTKSRYELKAQTLEKKLEKVSAFLSVFMETTDMSDVVKDHYRRELGILGVSESIKKKFNRKGVSKLHVKELPKTP